MDDAACRPPAAGGGGEVRNQKNKKSIPKKILMQKLRKIHPQVNTQ